MARVMAHEATIKTAMVEIKALTVGGRQVTQALFRQLQDEDLIDGKTLQFRGIPWGRVNYHVDDCKAGGEHLHVVWQYGDELRRAYVSKKKPDIYFYYKSKGWPEEDRMLQWTASDEPKLGIRPMSWDDKSQRVLASQYEGEFYREHRVYLKGSCYKVTAKRAEEIVRYWQQREAWLPDLNRMQSEWRRLYQSLEDLDQLFIAV